MTISVKKSLIFIGISAVLFYFVSELFIDKRVYRPINMSLYTVSGFYKSLKTPLISFQLAQVSVIRRLSLQFYGEIMAGRPMIFVWSNSRIY